MNDTPTYQPKYQIGQIVYIWGTYQDLKLVNKTIESIHIRKGNDGGFAYFYKINHWENFVEETSLFEDADDARAHAIKASKNPVIG